MKSFYRFLSALLAVSLLTVTGVAAAADATDFSLSASVSHSENCTIIEVTLNAPEERAMVAMTVTAPDGSVDYMTQEYTNEEGVARFRYIQKGNSGDYTVTANAVSVQKSVSLSYLAESDLAKVVDIFLEELHSQNPSWENIKVIYDYRGPLFLDMAVYESLKNPDNVYKRMLSDTADNANVKSVSDLVDLFHIAVMLTALEESGDSAMVEKFLKEEPYRSCIGFDAIMLRPESDVYEMLSDKAKAELMASVPNAEKYTSLAMLQERIQTNALCKGLQYAESWKHIEPLLKAYQKAGLLKISFTEYATLKNTSAVMENMIGQAYSGYQSVETRFAQCVSRQKANESGNKGGGTGGGSGGSKGGGSSSAGGSVLVTPNQPQPPVTDPVPAQPPADSPIKFVDIDEAKWATRPITKLAEAGIISGTGDGKFQPNREVTRAEFVKMLTGLFDEEPEQDSDQRFADVPESDWAFRYVNQAARVGLVVGGADGLFHPNDLVTREEMAVMTARLLKQLEISSGASGSASAFADAETVSEWAVDSVTALKAAGIVKGDLGNRFNPKNSLTRAEAAQIIYNVLSSAEEA